MKGEIGKRYTIHMNGNGVAEGKWYRQTPRYAGKHESWWGNWYAEMMLGLDACRGLGKVGLLEEAANQYRL
jgi:hypothetical protein